MGFKMSRKREKIDCCSDVRDGYVSGRICCRLCLMTERGDESEDGLDELFGE
jgi:hypothetical protein